MKSLYELDFYAWTQQQIHLLKEQAWQSLDVQNLVEELADLGRRERKELRNRLSVLLGHLLKWQGNKKLHLWGRLFGEPAYKDSRDGYPTS